jgi:hypothetical protein
MSHLDDDELDLDGIDGEFFWRCCQYDIWSAIERTRAIAHSTGRHHLLAMQVTEDDVIVAFDLSRFGPSGWLKLRDGLVTHYFPSEGDPLGAPRNSGEHAGRVELLVFSNRWTGADIEERIRSYITDPNRGIDDDGRRCWFGQAESIFVRVAFTFVPAGNAAPTPFRSFRRFVRPHVVVVVGAPFPPAGTIAKLYDDNVVAKEQWDKLLAGTPKQQEKRVALRTWAVGLLVGSGHRTARAIRDVSDVLGEEEISQVQFTEDRRRLVERVPEAQPFLYAKPPRSLALPQ